jgi:hypothetical protein
LKSYALRAAQDEGRMHNWMEIDKVIKKAQKEHGKKSTIAKESLY